MIGCSVGIRMPDNGAARDDEAASRSLSITSSPWQLSSSVEVHRASTSDSDSEAMESSVTSTELLVHCEGIAHDNAACAVDTVETVSIIEPDVVPAINFDHSGGTIV